MRQDMRAVDIGPVFQHRSVVIKPDPACLIEVYDPLLRAMELRKPDRSRVPDPQVPSRIDRQAWLIGDNGHSVVIISRAHFLAVVSPKDSRLKAALKLLLIAIIAHCPLGLDQLPIGKDAGLRSLKHHRKPVWIILGVIVNLPEFILSLWRPHERRAALPVSQGGADHCRPCVRGEVCRFIKRSVVEV